MKRSEGADFIRIVTYSFFFSFIYIYISIADFADFSEPPDVRGGRGAAACPRASCRTKTPA